MRTLSLKGSPTVGSQILNVLQKRGQTVLDETFAEASESRWPMESLRGERTFYQAARSTAQASVTVRARSIIEGMKRPAREAKRRGVPLREILPSANHARCSASAAGASCYDLTRELFEQPERLGASGKRDLSNEQGASRRFREMSGPPPPPRILEVLRQAQDDSVFDRPQPTSPAIIIAKFARGLALSLA